MTKRTPIFAYAMKHKGHIDLTSISTDPDDIIPLLNRPAGQRCVQVKIQEIPQPTRLRRAYGVSEDGK